MFQEGLLGRDLLSWTVFSISKTERKRTNSDQNPNMYITGEDPEDKSTTGESNASSQQKTG